MTPMAAITAGRSINGYVLGDGYQDAARIYGQQFVKNITGENVSQQVGRDIDDMHNKSLVKTAVY